ncbi:MAG: hypothetical protein IT164_01590 [Bryobacterales bacterium]|nr:hypothetical protein [Bryobacterales bacterium]
MKLLDVRRLAIEHVARVRFSTSDGSECLIDEHGVARIPTVRRTPDFDLEGEFASVQEFTYEPAAKAGNARRQAPARRLTRSELEQMCERKELAAHAAASQDHDE